MPREGGRERAGERAHRGAMRAHLVRGQILVHFPREINPRHNLRYFFEVLRVVFAHARESERDERCRFMKRFGRRETHGVPLGAELVGDLLAPRCSRLVEGENNYVRWARLERF